jgi:hypothetical protein
VKRERRSKLTRSDLAAVTSRRPVVRRIKPPAKRKPKPEREGL